MNNQLNDAFETILDLPYTSAGASAGGASRLNVHRSVLSAARVCLDEFSKMCKDCALEMEARDPKIVAHCR